VNVYIGITINLHWSSYIGGPRTSRANQINDNAATLFVFWGSTAVATIFRAGAGLITALHVRRSPHASSAASSPV
jgi:hypothetical protein